MDDFGDMFGGLGEVLGGLFGIEAADGGGQGTGQFRSPEAGRDRQAPTIVYERYLCGGPRELNVNDR